MKTISRDYVFSEKYKNRARLKKLETHADGGCIHMGKISPACRVCFTGEKGGGIQLGQECNANCTVCYYRRGRKNSDELGRAEDILASHFRDSFDDNWLPYGFAFQSAGETLMYIDKFLPFGQIFRAYEKRHGIKIYNYVYSNGLMINEPYMLDKLEELQVQEIRFHLSASKWNKKVLKNMELTRERGITLSVEEPSYPPERENILKHLPVLNDLGVKHMNLVEVQITQYNKPDIEKEYPEGRIFKDHFYHLYDEGLVYEVMEEVEKNNYNFSVLDCNSTVETYRQVKNQAIGFDFSTIDDMCAEFDYGNRCDYIAPHATCGGSYGGH